MVRVGSGSALSHCYGVVVSDDHRSLISPDNSTKLLAQRTMVELVAGYDFVGASQSSRVIDFSRSVSRNDDL